MKVAHPAAVVMFFPAAAAGPLAAQQAPPALRALCTDRPTKSTGPCTVDAGHVQIEADLFNVTLDRSGGIDTNIYLLTSPTLKYGVTDTLDVEAALSPWVEMTTRDRASGAGARNGGVGDLYLKAKLNLTGNGGAVGIAVEPFVKLPTARAPIGNGAVETGILAPISFALAAQFSLSLAPEIDLLKDAAGDGRHINVINLIGVSRPFGAVTAAAEFWSDVDFDPKGAVIGYSFDLGLAWIPTRAPALQIDGGVNLGLNRVTPGLQAYVGISHRF